MNKLLHMNSFFTRIILAVLSFAAIICVFVPYFQIPAVEAVHDVDVNEQTLRINIGKDAETVNIISEFSNGQPFLIYNDEALTQTVEPTALPTPGTPGTETTYWIQFFAYGYTTNAETGKKALDFIPLSVYTVVLNKSTESNTSVTVNKVEKKITITVPDNDSFDFARVIDTKNVWTIYDNRLTGFAESIKEARSLPVKRGERLQYYTAITLKSETNPMSTAPQEEGQSSIVYYPLDMYTLEIYRDDIRSTLPTVGEFGMGILSAKATSEAGGTMTLYSGDAWMFLLMILALISTLFSFVIPNKLRIIQTITGCLLGLLLIVMPILDYTMFYSQNHFDIEPGMYILMVLGVLILFFAIFDFIRCHAEYVAEQVHLYGEDYKEQRKAEKAEARIKAEREKLNKESTETDGKKALKKKEKKTKNKE